jgi:hypothetical protein
MKFRIACATWLLLTTCLSTTALAGSVLSPTVRIVALDMGDTVGMLRLGVRRRIEINAPSFDFNPAGCSGLTTSYNISGTNVTTHYFDVQLGTAFRSAAEQSQLLNEIYAAFATSRGVQLYVRDDLCTTADSRVATGMKVVY